MNERLLCKCQSSIVADRVTEVLEANGIASRRHDETNAPQAGTNTPQTRTNTPQTETNDPQAGTYGPTPGIAIYVFADHYEKARTLAEPLLNRKADSTRPFCPRCGSEDLVRIERSKYATPLLILSIFLFIAPCAYLYLTTGAENKSIVIDSLAIAVFIASIILMIMGGRKNANLRCRHCGKKFNLM